MTPAGRKSKGKNYEDRIAKLIHEFLLLKNNEYRELFLSLNNDNLRPRRDSSSGNFVSSTGDIDLNLAQKFFPFSVECKAWKSLDISLDSLLSAKLKILEVIWKNQVLPAAEKTGLRPLIIFKGNRTKDFCFYDKNVCNIIPINRFIKIDNWILCLFDDFIFDVNERIILEKTPFDEKDTQQS